MFFSYYVLKKDQILMAFKTKVCMEALLLTFIGDIFYDVYSMKRHKIRINYDATRAFHPSQPP